VLATDDYYCEGETIDDKKVKFPNNSIVRRMTTEEIEQFKLEKEANKYNV